MANSTGMEAWLEPMGTDNIIIVQMSPPRTGSTLLYNALCGLVCPDQPIIWVPDVSELPSHLPPLAVIKTHLLDPDGWCDAFGQERKAYFVSSERRGINRILTPQCANAANHLVFQYEDLLETRSYGLGDIVENIGAKCKAFLPDEVVLDHDSCLKRLVGMNEKVKELENESFKVWDKFYGVHGRHRNRARPSSIGR